MKKVLKIIFGIIGGTILLALLTVGIIFLMITSGRANPPEELYVEENAVFSFEDIYQKSLMNVKEDKQVKLTFTEEELNKIIYSAIVQGINENYYKTEEDKVIVDQNEFKIRSVYGEIKKGHIYLYAHVDSYIDAIINVKLELKQTETEFKLVVKSLRLGKLSFISGLGRLIINKVVLPKFDLEKELNDALDDTDFPLEFSMEDLSFSINKEELKAKVSDLMATSIGEPSYSTLLAELVSAFIDREGVLNLGVSEANEAGLVIDISDFAYDGEITAPKFDFEDFASKLVTLDEHNILTNDNFSLINSYLLAGYENLNEENKATIATYDFSSIGIINPSLHEGYSHIVTASENLQDTVKADLYSEIADLSDGKIKINLNENTVNNVLASTPIIGDGYSLYRSDSVYERYTYLGVESLYCDIVNDSLSFNLSMNLNGQKILLSTDFDQDTTVTQDVKLQLNDVNIGTYHMSSNARLAIMDILEGVIGANDLIKIEGDSLVVKTSNFKSYLGTEGLIDTIIQATLEDTLSFTLTGVEGLSDDSFTITLNLTDFKTTATLPETIKEPFVKQSFVTEQALRIIFSDTAGSSVIRFTDTDINRTVYQDTHEYADLATTEVLDDGITTMNTKVDGIVFHFYDPVTTVEYLLDVNGFKTRAYLELTVSNNNSAEVILTPSPTLLLGSKAIDSTFMLNYVSESFVNNEVLKYDSVNNVFRLSANSFYELMTVGGISTFTVDKIAIDNGGINITVSVSEDQLLLLAALSTAQAAFQDVTQQEFFDPSLYNTEDPEQAAAISELQNQLDEIRNNQLNGEPISDEDISALLDNVNGLSEENKDIFFGQVDDEFTNQGYPGVLDALELAMYL
ncbi:MAG TPA: hypothetical protein GXZ51_04575 [Acholeplasma sp.]|nr:hypothetical protein [Acholeplasma sp.]